MTIAQMKSSIHDPDCDKDLQNYRDQIDQLTSKFDQTLDEIAVRITAVLKSM
jgi:hypothetical protein